jgi:hypothetical protein
MLSDQPITSAKYDLLGRSAFARRLASALYAAPKGKNGSFTVGLCGSWGSGKTSILNMTVEAMEKRRSKTPVIVRFNPWHYPAEELLPGQFLLALATELKKPMHGRKLNKAAKAVEKYAAAFAACPPPDLSLVLDAASKGKSVKKKKRKQKSRLPKSVSQRRDAVCKLLRKQKKKIYVVMDDVDRLSPGRLCHALQLVSVIAGFPRMVFLLAFDFDVVAAALDRELGGQGRGYMKKFFQALFDVPAPESAQINNIFMAYVHIWLKTQPGLNFDPAYFDQIAPFLFQAIGSIRDVYRFVNTFRVRYQAVGNEVNFIDLLAVTALQLHAPQALSWIQAHRDDLLRGGGLFFRSVGPAQKRHLKEEHKRKLYDLSENDAQTLITLIGHMFPRYGRNVLDVGGDGFDPRLIRMRRICCEEFFDLYFTQSTDALAITQEEILKTVREMDASALRAYTDRLTPERRNAYLNHLPHYVEDIPKRRLPMLFNEMLWLSRLPEGEMPAEQPFQRSFFHTCGFCALRILARMPDEMRQKSLQEAVTEADRHTIPILITLLGRIRRGMPGAQGVMIDDEILAVYLRRLLEKIHAIALDGNWLLSHHPLPVLEYWKQADAVSFRVYFERLMQDDRNAARMVSHLTQRFDQGENMEYQYGDMDGLHAFFAEFPTDTAQAAIRRLRGTDTFMELPENVRLDCVALSLTDETNHRVSRQAVLETYPTWENENKENRL